MSHFHPSLCPHSTFLLLENLISLISQELTLLASSPPPPSSFPCPFTSLYHFFNTTLAPWGFDSITFSWQPTPRSPVPYSTKDPHFPRSPRPASCHSVFLPILLLVSSRPALSPIHSLEPRSSGKALNFIWAKSSGTCVPANHH